MTHNQYQLHTSLAWLLLLLVSHAASGDTRIAFGSCSHQAKPQPVWEAVLSDRPEMFIFLGDNIYGDSRDPAVLEKKYQQLAAKPGFRELRNSTRVVATWDDHDYGENDAGREYPAKQASRDIMLDFWQVPADSPRRTQPGGIYTSYMIEDGDKRIQVILLDTRWNRSPLIQLKDADQRAKRNAQNRGPYQANLAQDAELMGEAQWQWLEQQLQVPADVRLIGSSIQVLTEFTGWEAWANFPRERLRLIDLLEKHQSQPIVLLSGDVHWAELSRIEHPGPAWPLIELTSSGLTEEWKAISPNRHRTGEAFAVPNYGLVDIRWEGDKPVIQLTIKKY